MVAFVFRKVALLSSEHETLFALSQRTVLPVDGFKCSTLLNPMFEHFHKCLAWSISTFQTTSGAAQKLANAFKNGTKMGMPFAFLHDEATGEETDCQCLNDDGASGRT